MKKILLLTICLYFCGNLVFAQEKSSEDPDMPYKLELYKKYKNHVRGFSHKDFEEYFSEYFSKIGNTALLTRDEYYTYTIKIAIYSEKLGLLYKDRKEEAQKSKEDWFSKKYSDYLSSRTPKTDAP